MTKVVGFLQSKGGVGKTTTCLNLAAELRRRGLKVSVLDADPSQSACLVAEDGKLSFPVDSHPLEATDTKSLGEWRKVITNRKGDVDFILIDAPGTMGAAFGATMAVSDIVVVPSGATVLDVREAAKTIGMVRHHRKTTARQTPDILILPSRIDKRTGAGRDAVKTLASLTEPVGPPISYRATVADALAMGETVSPTSESAGEYVALATAILTRLGEFV